MKKLAFVGDSLKQIRNFAGDAMQDVGFQLHKVQIGEQPDDFKPMPTIGTGVEELRVWDESGTYRVVYTARFQDTVFVLHAFQKKTEQTAQSDIDLAKKRYKQVKEEQNGKN
ncbi:type II toxin-antitoxin system RelE/ParE family toxin [Oxalobacteraceae bacterium OTU3CINTB1]|nr:type II toxin-antitoxin system RelE/ParE family toxin [Oxalobacteraceae bacterium OTU3CINTB1]